MVRRRLYVWEVPVRLTHWVNVVCIALLSFTGYYIGNPYIVVSEREIYGPYFMGLMRFLHFATAIVFTISVGIRTYWAFVGNQWSSWRGLFPFLTREGRQNIVQALKYYLFLRREPPEVTGHNALAGMTYMFIVIFYFTQMLTGFALFGLLHPTSIWGPLLGWVFQVLDVQTVRLIHHIVMYLILAFVVHHVYAAWLVDMEEGNGLMSSIFSGFKFMPTTRRPDWLERSQPNRSNPR